jgi:hypothetical protein
MNVASMLCLAAWLAAAPPAPPEAPADNPELAQMYRDDQAARDKPWDNIDWAEVSRRDGERRARVLALLAQGDVRTSADFYHAAMVFQHGDTPDEIRLAHSLSWISATLDPSNESARWLAAAAWDRFLMRKNLPQWYGTQYTRSAPGERWKLYKVDESAVTDEERAALHVPPLRAARARVKEMNKP